LQSRTNNLAAELEALTHRTVEIESALRTLAVNRKIVQGLLGPGTVFHSAPQLARFLVDDLADHLEARATSELGFRRATLERAKVHWESLDATIELQQADQSRKLALFMAVLTCLQGFTLFPLLFPKGADWDFETWSLFARWLMLGCLLLLLWPAFVWINRSR
jgi:hypothetical protein